MFSCQDDGGHHNTEVNLLQQLQLNGVDFGIISAKDPKEPIGMYGVLLVPMYTLYDEPQH